MADFTNSANMSLPIPTVGIAPGPEWATLLDNCLTIIDRHDHTPGNGVPIPVSALNINADLPVNSNNVTLARSLRFSPNIVAIALPADIGALYVVGNDLYYNDSVGNQIRLTQSGSIVGTAGSITGLPSGTASVVYNAIQSTYVFQSATGIAGNLDAGSLSLRDTSPDSNFAVTLQAPVGLGANYAITLPLTPVSDAPLIMNSAGIITADVSLRGAFCPTGAIFPFAGVSVPTGWLYCDGSTVSRTTYANLYSIIGNAFGSGNGTTTFNIPDFRGQFMRGVDNGAGRDPDASTRTAMNAGGNTGDNVGSLEGSLFGSHAHSLNDPGHFHTLQLGDSAASVNPAKGGVASFTGHTDVAVTGITVNAAGGNETRPINANVNYIIKI